MAIKKLDVTDLGKLQALVIENLQELEPGLALLDSRLLLGHATIDVVAMDANSTLVLVALGFSADEEMLLKAVEAYSWCLEYPQAIRRLYPAARISESRPPRMVFVVGRVPDAFHRKVKQLGFPEVDCVEFRHLEVDGAPVMYFDTILQLRRSVPGAMEAPAASPERRSHASANGHGSSPVVPPSTALDVAPGPAVERSEASRPVRPGVTAAAAPMVEKIAPVLETDLNVLEADPPTAQPEERNAEPAVPPSMEPLAALLEQMSAAVSSSPMIEPLPVAEPEPSVRMPTLEVPGLSLEPQVRETRAQPEPKPLAAAETGRETPGARSIAEAARAAFAAATPSFGDRPATPPASPTPPPAAEKPKAETEAAKPAPPLPQEFAGLNFPNDGVLTRQWMEFLSRMANSK